MSDIERAEVTLKQIEECVSILEELPIDSGYDTIRVIMLEHRIDVLIDRLTDILHPGW